MLKVEKTGQALFLAMAFQTIVEWSEIKVQLIFCNQSGHMDGHMVTLFQKKMMLMKQLIII